MKHSTPKYITALAAVAVMAFAVSAASCPPAPGGGAGKSPQWKLAWEDDFDKGTLDTAVWSMTDRGTPDWADTQSHDPRCFEFRDGCLVLKGIVNDDLEKDPSPYLTGGIWTKHKKSFEPGRFLIRAKLQGAEGAWPAIWLMPFDQVKWPSGGEIDIMERLNFEDAAYQTVHSDWTYTLGHTKDPESSRRSPIDPDGFNVYGVDMLPDSIVFHINGIPTLTYPKKDGGAEGQFPFYRNQFILIDMQLGGNWVGKVDPADLPVEMEVDWVRYYRLTDNENHTRGQ